MAKRSVVAVATDFADVVSFLTDQGLIPEAPGADLMVVAKAIHQATYSLILWRFRLRRLPVHSQVFVEEIASDALQVLPQVLMGYSKTAKLLIRGILENVMRHIYFSDHPIEFARMNREAKWFLTMDQLYEYAKMHPEFLKAEKRFNAVDQASSLYSELSAGIHGRTVSDLEMRAALKKIVFDLQSAQYSADLLRRSAQSVNFLLAIFHQGQMRGFHLEDRRIILRTLPAQARKVWNEHE